VVSTSSVVFDKSIRNNIFNDVVQVDVSKIKSRSIVDVGMEIFTANEFGESCNNGCNDMAGMGNIIKATDNKQQEPKVIVGTCFLEIGI
jgi:hypothetical protein